MSDLFSNVWFYVGEKVKGSIIWDKHTFSEDYKEVFRGASDDGKAIRIRNNRGYLFEVQHLNDRSRNKVDSWTSHESGFTKAFALRTNYNILRDDFDNELILSYDFEGIRIVDGCRVVDYLVKKSDDILFRSSFFVSNYVDYNWLNVTLSGIDYEMWYSDSCANFYINFSSDLDTIKVENVFVIHLGLFTVFVDNCSGKIVCLGVKDVVYIPDGITNMVDIGLAEVDNKIVPIYEDKDDCVIYGFIDGFKLELLDTSFDDSIAILYMDEDFKSFLFKKCKEHICDRVKYKLAGKWREHYSKVKYNREY